MSKVLTIGGATQDIYIRYTNAETMRLVTANGVQSYLLLQEGAKIEVSELVYSIGGGAINTAIAFERMGFDASVFVKIGDDAPGKFILKKLQEHGISTDFVVISKDSQSGTSFIIPSLERDRVIMAMRGSNTKITLKDVPFKQITASDLLYITSLSGDSSKLLLPMAERAHKHNVLVATNPGGNQLKNGAKTLLESLKFIDILIMNSAEAQTFMSSTNLTNHAHLDLDGSIDSKSPLHSFFKELLKRGPKVVVVTNGNEGVYAATEGTLYFHPSLPVTVVNTVGAGDTFGSTFAATFLQTNSVEHAIRYGLANASSVITHMDTKEGLLDMKQLAARAKKIDLTMLQKKPLS